jgi:methylmalonyl-CoA/ethylmalonyl-CoA epimerase
VNKIEHLGIAVANLEEAEARWTALLGVAPYRREEVPTEGVRTSFFQAGPNKVELLEAMHADSPIAKFIAKRGEGIHHTAFAVDDIRSEMARMKAAGFQVLSDEPKPGAENMCVFFVHPKDANGVLVELCQPRS